MKKGKRNYFKYLAIILIVISLVFIGLIQFMNLLPLKYFSGLTLGLIILDILSIFLLFRKNRILKIWGILFSVVLMSLMVLAISYQFSTISFLQKMGLKKYSIENYGVYVLKESEFKNILDLNNKDIIYIQEKDKDLEKAFEILQKKITVNFLERQVDVIDLAGLDTGILIKDAYVEIIREINENFFESLIKIYSFSIKKEMELENKQVDINKESFNVYISGIDTYGDINSVSRSDVNMIISVNPKTNKVLLTSIPRDYYVLLSKYNEYDKLTHSGIYGIDTSIKTLENLLDIDINYFIKVNFSSLTTIVEALNGINVYSNYDFTTQNGYHFIKGNQKINGKEALAFSRERKAFSSGDRIRIENQQIVLMGILNKLVSPSIIVNYNSFLTSLKGKFITNINQDTLTRTIKKQIAESPEWKFENISLNGTDASEYTYSYKNQKLYVMKPDQNSLSGAREKIKSILVG